jgi:hypothetical protein
MNAANRRKHPKDPINKAGWLKIAEQWMKLAQEAEQSQMKR